MPTAWDMKKRSREDALKQMQRALKEGSLVIRQMTPDERREADERYERIQAQKRKKRAA